MRRDETGTKSPPRGPYFLTSSPFFPPIFSAQILKKQPASDKIKETDTFTINPSFSCPQRVIRIPMATIEESHNPNRIEVNIGHTRGRASRMDAHCFLVNGSLGNHDGRRKRERKEGGGGAWAASRRGGRGAPGRRTVSLNAQHEAHSLLYAVCSFPLSASRVRAQEDRSIAIEAAIVRIMKARKVRHPENSSSFSLFLLLSASAPHRPWYPCLSREGGAGASLSPWPRWKCSMLRLSSGALPLFFSFFFFGIHVRSRFSCPLCPTPLSLGTRPL